MSYNVIKIGDNMIKQLKKLKYIKDLKKETNDGLFIKKVNELLQKISKCNEEINDNKITNHFEKIKNKFLNKTSNDITYLETKKMVFNYHLYLLEEYYNKIYNNLFFQKSSN